jgi:hypothetical protein
LPELLDSVERAGTNRASYLGVTWPALRESVLALLGLNRSYFWGTDSTWDVWPAWRGLLLLAMAPAVAAGLLVLRRRPLAAAVTLALLAGTVLTAASISLVSPAYAERTILPAVLGWSLLLGAAASLRAPGWQRSAAAFSMVFVLAMSLITVRAVYRGDKQHWRELARSTQTAALLNVPVVTIPTITDTLITLYAPDALAGRHVVVHDGDELPRKLIDEAPPALWLAYLETSTAATVRDQLAERGYERLLHRVHRDALYLDLYVRPDVQLGEPVDVNGAFGGTATEASGWRLPATDARLEADQPGARTLMLESDGERELSALRVVPAQPQHLYTLAFEARSTLASGNARAFLVCAGPTGEWLSIDPDDAGIVPLPAGGWRRVRFATVCPAGTTQLYIDLRNNGQGQVSFRQVDLWQLLSKGLPGSP